MSPPLQQQQSSSSSQHHGSHHHHASSSHSSISLSSLSKMGGIRVGISVGLPLLEGLAKRPETSQKIVQEALRRHQAGQRIGRWYLAMKKRKNKNNVVYYYDNHWLWTTLQSESRPERQMAVRILLHHPHPQQLQPLLVSLVEQHIQSCTNTTMIPSRGVLEWIALLKQILVPEEFCLVGIPWLTQSIWKLVTVSTAVQQKSHQQQQRLDALMALIDLCHSLLLVLVENKSVIPSSSSTDHRLRANNSNTNNRRRRRKSSSRQLSPKATTSVMTDHSLQKQQQQPSSTERLDLRCRMHQNLLWESNKTANQMSSLACLIGTYHLLLTNTDLSFQIRGMDAAVSLLKQMVDLHATVNVVSTMTTTTSATTASTSTTGKKQSSPQSSSSQQAQRDVALSRLRRLRDATHQRQQQQQQQQQQRTPSYLFRRNRVASNNNRTRIFDSEELATTLRGTTMANNNSTSSTHRNNYPNHPHPRRAQRHRNHEHEDDDLSDFVIEDDDDDEDDDEEMSVEGASNHQEAPNEEDAHHEEDDEDDEEEDDDDDDEDEEDDDEEDAEDDEEIESVEADGTGAIQSDEGEEENREEDDDDDDDDDAVVEEDDEGGGGRTVVIHDVVHDPHDDDDDDDDEVEDVDDDLARLEQGLLELNEGDETMGFEIEEDTTNNTARGLGAHHTTVAAAAAANRPTTPNSNNNNSSTANSSSSSFFDTQQRKQVYILSCMEVLTRHYQNTSVLSLKAEKSLIDAIKHVVRPPKKPVNTKLILRRAPTQEEFFRGSLSKNPISLNMLKRNNTADTYEPTVKDLRQHIANDLQMSDSAELLELLVANKIVDIHLKLRVVHQVLWRNHLIENSTTSSSSALSSLLASGGGGAAGGGTSIFSTGSGLSMMFSSSLLSNRSGGTTGSSRNNAGGGISADTPSTSLPPLVVTYRLAGVDGEATEDTVTELTDPEAPDNDKMSPEEIEKLMEKEYGITRLLTDDGGVAVLLESIERHLMEVLRKIRRDSVDRKNSSRETFKTSPPYAGLVLLSACAKLPSNRRRLLQARAPTVLLRLLLDVLNALEDETERSSTSSNPTAEMLQGLIEALACEISTVPSETGATTTKTTNNTATCTSTLELLMSSIETISLSPPLRKIIAKLLPFLTYGQENLSKALALNFYRNIDINMLAQHEQEYDEDNMKKQSSTDDNIGPSPPSTTGDDTERPGVSAIMSTLVQTSISLPANDVCNALREQLMHCGFIERIAHFVLENVPTRPPPWSPALWAKGSNEKDEAKERLEQSWRLYFLRKGLCTAFRMLIGLCRQHAPTQEHLGKLEQGSVTLLQALHWMESTSDKASARIYVKEIGLLAETLMDEVIQDNDIVKEWVTGLRKKTRLRKKQIAEERRNKALDSMHYFGGMNLETAKKEGRSVRAMAASLLGPALGYFRDNNNTTAGRVRSASPSSSQNNHPARKKQKLESGGASAAAAATTAPSWLQEMESMQDEAGLTCAVCQEGLVSHPTELLGLYAYVKKVTIPLDQCGASDSIDGTSLLRALPPALISALRNAPLVAEWFTLGKKAADDLLRDSQPRSAFSLSSSSSISSSRRNAYYTTTVSAGNAIHFSCHQKARQADRNHPKAPKSEWEGASLRNSRVNCNVILPLVSSQSSNVPLAAVDSALTEHQTAVSNLIDTTPRSMLWSVLIDIRFLLLRMAYGESLNVDCGGGSLASNTQLLLYELQMADMFEKDTQVDSPETAQHARNLSAGFLAACAVVQANESKPPSTLLMRAICDSAPMAALSCILLHNVNNSHGEDNKAQEEKPDPKRRWMLGKDYFLKGLINCAGRRHALGIQTSGCVTGRNNRSIARSSAYVDWQEQHQGTGVSSQPSIDDFGNGLRPMITLYAILDQLSAVFVLSRLGHPDIDDMVSSLEKVMEDCQRSKSIHELLKLARVTLEEERIVAEFQKGMVAA